MCGEPALVEKYTTMLSTKRGVRAQHGNALLSEGVKKVFGMSAAL